MAQRPGHEGNWSGFIWRASKYDVGEKWSEKSTSKVLECIGGIKTFPNNIHRRKANWNGHVLRRNCLIYDDAENRL